MSVIGEHATERLSVARSAAEVASTPWQQMSGMPGIEIKILSATEAGRCGLLRFGSGAHELPHSHERGAHHVWVLEGGMFTGSQHYETGSYLLTRSHQRHMLEADASGCTLFYVYVDD